MRDRLDLPLLTWRLWNALRWPPVRNPVYGRTLRTSQRGRQVKISEVLIPGVVRKRSPLWGSPMWGFVAGIALVFLICSGGWVILIPLLCATPLLMLGAGTACGLICAIKITTTLSAEHERGRHDLLALTPSGAAGTAWAVSSAVYNNSPLMNQIKDLARGVYFLLALGAAWLTLPVLLNFGRFTFYSGNLVALVALAALYLDLIQSIVAGCLVGMIVSTYTRSPFDARALAFGGFLALQFLYYALLALTNFAALPFLLRNAPWPLLLAMQIGLFYLLREVLIVGLWYTLAHRLEASVDELNRAAWQRR